MPPVSPRARQALVRRLLDRGLHGPGGVLEVVQGHHNTNYVLRCGPLLALLLGTTPYARVKYRVPLVTVEVVPRIWPREADVLRVVCRHLREVPRCLAVLGDHSLHRYRTGRALSEANPDGEVGEALMREFAAFFVRTARVPVAQLPPPPAGWPADGDSDGFLRRLADFTERRVHRPNRARFGALFDAVGIPEDAMAVFLTHHTGLTSRPFTLLHTDVHRANVVVRRGRIAVIDWELAMYGDPLHDLATHLVRMGYGKEQQDRMTRLWARAMTEAGLSDLAAGLADDLGAYVAFEYAQSVFPDTMRAALALPDRPQDAHFRAAAERVSRALGRAREPLRLVDVPDGERIEEALREWHGGHAPPPAASP
ncbi:Thiamine kinase [Streptomyces sp. enrichment culture]|uniref:phosphotransferase family protein n=1 Tax=Streptomyces sp. enrichment culture TaxID=1795815 RepID=UPI003F55EB0E